MSGSRWSILIVTPLALSMHAQGAEKPADYGWHDDYQKARALALKTGKPLMVVFRCQP